MFIYKSSSAMEQPFYYDKIIFDWKSNSIRLLKIDFKTAYAFRILEGLNQYAHHAPTASEND